MSEQKLVRELDQIEIKQTSPIRFKDDAINKIRKQNIVWNKRTDIFIPFKVSKDSHQKGLKLRVFKGALGDKDTRRVFYVQYWFDGRAKRYRLGDYSQRFGKTECDDLLKEVFKNHTDPETGFWIKDPNETRKNEARIVEKPDTTTAKGYTVNEVIEAYCGAPLDDVEAERGFSKDRRDGYRAAKHAREWFRSMVGYNHRDTLVRFYDDDDGYGVAEFRSNKHLRIAKPLTWRDFFRKYPPGRGITKDRVYYNRRKKQTYTIPASKNYCIYDHDLGKSLISDLKPGDVEYFCKDLSSMSVKESYVKVFITLWIYARKRGWLGTAPGECPFFNQTVYIKKEPKKYEDKYKNVAIEDPAQLALFWECSEELSEQFPFKAELHQFMLLTAMRKTEALKMEKKFIDFEKGTLFIPKGISKTKYRDEELPITPELEVLLRNILDLGERPDLDFYKMRDFRWLFATRAWKKERYFKKDFRMSTKARLGGDEKYIPVLRKLMQEKSGDPTLLYAPKILRKTYITKSQQVFAGRSEITQQMSRHRNIDVLNSHYNKPGIETRREYASEVSKVFSFIQRRSA
jgi:integrase|tara:strand:+ start:1529 stop:3247 length:1719 start_codon:yes stop_codon:yes gene_type:complete